MKTIPTRVAAVLAAALVLIGAPSAATAEVVVLRLWGSDGATSVVDRIEIPIDDTGNFSGEGVSSTNLWEIEWGLAGNADPIVNSNFTVLNSMGVPQDFNVTVTVPAIPPLSAPTRTSGSLGVTVTDANGDGATLSTRAVNSAPIYTALIDSAVYDTLLDHPYSLSAGAFASNADSDSFGLPGITQPGPAVTTDIGIQIQFTLTGRDLAGITSTFTVVPEPTSLVLAAVALAGCLCLRRR